MNNTKKFLYYINYEKHTRQKNALSVKKPSESVKQKAERLRKTHEIMRQKDARKKKGIKRRDKKKNKSQLKKKNKVYLLTDNLRTKRPSKKLDHRKVGPFLIKAVKKPRKNLTNCQQALNKYEQNCYNDHMLRKHGPYNHYKLSWNDDIILRK